MYFEGFFISRGFFISDVARSAWEKKMCWESEIEITKI